MDDRERVILQWLLQNISTLNLVATAFDWPTKIGLDLFDLEVQITIDSKVYIGRGSDKNSNRAFVKAGAEAIERYLCCKNKISTSGVALHYDEALAREGALLELLERDAFFCHYLTKTAFVECHSTHFQFQCMEFLKSGIELKFYELPTFEDVHTIIAIAKGNENSNLGVLVGLGCRRTKDEALEAAFTEAARNVVAEVEGKLKRIDAPVTIEDHLFYGAHRLNNGIFDDFINRDVSRKTKEMRHVVFDKMVVGDFPFIAVRASSDNLQSAFWGMTSKACVNIERLASFLDTDIKFKDINKKFHPFG